MENYQTNLLLAASRLLSYPSSAEEEDVMKCIEEMDTAEVMKKKVLAAANAIYRIPLRERMEVYVSTFDLQKELGLYLSAHEFGDSPKRGAALIKLQKIIIQGGYDRIDSELADYIPLLYEFAAVAEEYADKDRLMKRLGAVTQRILNSLPEESPYQPLVSVMMAFVFVPPTKEELEEMELEREEADLEELPYPIMYK